MKTVIAGLLWISAAGAQERLPGTAPLVYEGDAAASMVDGIHAFLSQASARPATGTRDRERLARIIGAVDRRVAAGAPRIDAAVGETGEVSAAAGYRVYAVRWAVFDDLTAEGLLLQPVGAPTARIVAIPDADQTPEAVAAGWGRRLAESGCQVLIPTLIDRADKWSGVPGAKMTNLPHREWIYRMAYETGRHIIGYEVQKVLSAVDWFAAENTTARARIGVAGYGEGGLIALYTAALDQRIEVALVSGYFHSQRDLWREPIYRDVWGIHDFDDATVAGMIAPRAVVVEASRVPEVNGPPAATPQRRGAAPGRLVTPAIAEVREEVSRVRPAGHVRLIGNGNAAAGSEEALAALLELLGARLRPAAGNAAKVTRDTEVRQHRQFDEMVDHTQAVIRASGEKRAALWAKADGSSGEAWRRSTQSMRETIWNDMIGRMPDPSVPANARSRQVYDEPKFRGYEVMLDVWPGVFAYGILLVPKDIQPGERRAVVVCQHGLEGRPKEVVDPRSDSAFYHRFGTRLAEEGYVVFAPQNPYIGEDRFRQIQRKGRPLRLSLFSFILGQHQRILEWLGGLEFVDAKRIGFYGLSYGGKTAVRVPPLLDGYALSICSADFNEWVWKNTSVDSRYSYLLTQEYDMIEFGLAETANYSDLANLMAPRPFMVERGHNDTVAPDEWVAYEYAKTARFYSKMGIPDRTAIEFFEGPHTIHGVGTFEFLRRFLGRGRE